MGKSTKQKRFESAIKNFSKIEDARDALWDKARVLLNKGFKLEAYILILATWNFAYFRYFLKNFDLKGFIKVINLAEPEFKKLEKNKFEKVDFYDCDLQTSIKNIYEKFKKYTGQTGATKLMALRNPKLFIMWDTEIRKIYKINNRATPEDYIGFLDKMKKKFTEIKWNSKTTPFAKAIDEYNYVIAEKRRTKNKVRKRDR